jgi:hypothetical protein
MLEDPLIPLTFYPAHLWYWGDLSNSSFSLSFFLSYTLHNQQQASPYPTSSISSALSNNMSTSASHTISASPAPTLVGTPQVSTASATQRQLAPRSKQIPFTTYAEAPFSIEASESSQHLVMPSKLEILETGSAYINMDNFALDWKHHTAQQFHKLRQQHYGELCQEMLSFIEQHPDKSSYRGVSVSDTEEYRGPKYQDFAEFAIRSNWIPKEEFATLAHANSIHKEYVELKNKKVRSTEDFDLIDSVITNSELHAKAAKLVFDH